MINMPDRIIKKAALIILMMLLMITACNRKGLFPGIMDVYAAEIISSGSSDSGDVSWVRDSDGVLTISGTGMIPDGFYKDGGVGLKSVVIEQGITGIGSRDFSYCDDLETVFIPESVITIGENAFLGTSFKTYYQGTREQWNVVANAGNVGNPYVLYEESYVPLNHFFGENMDWAWTYEEYVDTALTIIGHGNMPDFESVSGFPWGKYRDSFEEVCFKGEVKHIGAHAFDKCSSLRKVNLPEGLISIGEYAFYHTPVQTISFPSSLQEISAHAFEQSDLKGDIVIPEGVQTIGTNAFCSLYTCKLSIPASITSAGDNACGEKGEESNYVYSDFSRSELLSLFPEPNYFRTYVKAGGVNVPLFYTCGENLSWHVYSEGEWEGADPFVGGGTLVISGTGQMDDFTSPDQWKGNTITGYPGQMPAWSMQGSTGYDYYSAVRTIVIESGVESIGNNAFYDWDELKDITIPGSVTSIGDNIFPQERSGRTIYCNSGSFAERYAVDHHDPYRYIEENPYGVHDPGQTASSTTSYDCIWFGSYLQSSSETRKPIKWRVLSVHGNDAFLLADKALDCKPYHEAGGDVTWETCSLRSWLNNDFFGAAFTSAEQNAVISVLNQNDNNAKYGTNGGNATSDKVFLLSLEECAVRAYGFPYNLDFMISASYYATATDYAINQGAAIYNDSASWWTRTPGRQANYAVRYESASKQVYTSGTTVSLKNTAVRPCLHLDLSNDVWSNAGTVTSDGLVDEIAAPAINVLSINDMEIDDIDDQFYTGDEITPQITIRDGDYILKVNEDYNISLRDNIEIGTAVITITGTGKYSGTTEKTFKIVKRDGGEGSGSENDSGSGGSSDSGSGSGSQSGNQNDNPPGGSNGLQPSNSGVHPGETNKGSVSVHKEKLANPMLVKGNTVKVKYSKLLKKNQIIKTAKAFTVKNAQGSVTYKVSKFDKKAKKKITVSKTGTIKVKKKLKKGTYKVKVKVTAAGNTLYKPLMKTVTVKIKIR